MYIPTYIFWYNWCEYWLCLCPEQVGRMLCLGCGPFWVRFGGCGFLVRVHQPFENIYMYIYIYICIHTSFVVILFFSIYYIYIYVNGTVLPVVFIYSCQKIVLSIVRTTKSLNLALPWSLSVLGVAPSVDTCAMRQSLVSTEMHINLWHHFHWRWQDL